MSAEPKATLTRTQMLSDIATPVSLFYKLCNDLPFAFLLESTETPNRLARYSFIGFAPRLTVTMRGGRAKVDHFEPNFQPGAGPYPSRPTRQEIVPFQNPLQLLSQLADTLADERPASLLTDLPTDLPFCGGWVGYLGYGATQYFEGITSQTVDPFEVPEACYGYYDTFIAFDHMTRTIGFISWKPEEEAQGLWDRVTERIVYGPQLRPLLADHHRLDDDRVFERVQAPWSEKDYCQGVLQAKAWIQEGQVFQLVLAHRYSLPTSADPMDVYRTLQSLNPSPYAYYLKFPDFVYLGSSPETFVTCHNGRVILRALAGTRPRGHTPEEDEALEADLLANVKEMAEHRMLVDLARNDLGRVCQVGSIALGPIGTITKYTHVMHLATEVEGQLSPGQTAYQVFQSVFPRGTVSGAPKIRAMELLSQLEPEQRGIYSGVVGYFDCRGNADGAIAIRSALMKDGVAHVQAGAGIVYDSDPLSEYVETRNKAKSILKAIQLAERTQRHVHSPR